MRRNHAVDSTKTHKDSQISRPFHNPAKGQAKHVVAGFTSLSGSELRVLNRRCRQLGALTMIVG